MLCRLTLKEALYVAAKCWEAFLSESWDCRGPQTSSSRFEMMQLKKQSQVGGRGGRRDFFRWTSRPADMDVWQDLTGGYSIQFVLKVEEVIGEQAEVVRHVLPIQNGWSLRSQTMWEAEPLTWMVSWDPVIFWEIPRSCWPQEAYSLASNVRRLVRNEALRSPVTHKSQAIITNEPCIFQVESYA